MSLTKKQLLEEGITEEMISAVNMKLPINPVQLNPNDEPVNLIRCSKGFWVSVDGAMVKDANNEYFVVSDKDARIARARYLSNFDTKIQKDNAEMQNKIFQKLVDQEVLRLKKEVDEKLSEAKHNIRMALLYSGLAEPEGLEMVIMHQREHDPIPGNKALYQAQSERAKQICDQDTIELYEKLSKEKELGDSKDYDSLYAFLIQGGLPQIASFSYDKPKDIAAMIRNFSHDNIAATIMEIQERGHLENVARFNIEKKKS